MKEYLENHIIEQLIEDMDNLVRESVMLHLIVKSKNFIGDESVAFNSFAFKLVCERVNDIDIVNRQLACFLLGEFINAELDSLLLSIDKESEKESDWCPAGAFVIAMEDQYEVIRSTAIQSLTRLALHRPDIAPSTLNLIIDTFNDESETVRLVPFNAC